jgi:hypothetical protein
MVKGGRFICEDENPFTITISKTPVLSQPFNIAICGSYTSILVEGNYFGGVEQNIAGDHLQRSNFIHICSA